VVPVGQGAAQATEPDDVGMPGGRAQDCGVAAADHEPDPAAGRQAVQPRLAQAEVLTLPGDCLACQQRSNGVGELGQTPGAVNGCGPVLPDVVPLPRRMAGADAKHDPARRENVERSCVRRHVHRLAHARLDDVNTELQRRRHGRGAAQGRPGRHSGTWVVAHQQRAEAGRLHPAREHLPGLEVSRLGLHVHHDIGHQANLLAPGPRSK